MTEKEATIRMMAAMYNVNVVFMFDHFNVDFFDLIINIVTNMPNENVAIMRMTDS